MCYTRSIRGALSAVCLRSGRNSNDTKSSTMYFYKHWKVHQTCIYGPVTWKGIIAFRGEGESGCVAAINEHIFFLFPVISIFFIGAYCFISPLPLASPNRPKVVTFILFNLVIISPHFHLFFRACYLPYLSITFPSPHSLPGLRWFPFILINQSCNYIPLQPDRTRITTSSLVYRSEPSTFLEGQFTQP